MKELDEELNAMFAACVVLYFICSISLLLLAIYRYDNHLYWAIAFQSFMASFWCYVSFYYFRKCHE